MIRSVSIHELVESELNDAIDFYESKVKGLGLTFLAEVERATKFIQQFPEASPQILNVIRKKVIRNFPYSIMYSIVGDSVRILSVAHQKRRPYYWHSRK
ncbi:MAG: type II toxin-antitoxin system RelE/ParE family toxin [Bacteroidota bacterium]